MDCGTEISPREGKGRPFTRCLACRATRKPRSQAREIRESACADCGDTFAVVRSADMTLLRGPIRCPECKAKVQREKQYRWRDANPEKWKAHRDKYHAKRMLDPNVRRDKRERELRRLYGIEPEELQRLVDAQGGKCAICGRRPPLADDSKPLPRGQASTRLHLDHCHTTGDVRGLLCGKCNTMIGLAGENPDVLLAAVEYLRKE